MKKKQKRQRRDPQTQAAAVARAQVVGLTEAAREIGCAPSVLSRWVRKAGVAVPHFHFSPGGGLRRIEPEATGLGAGNPEPRQVAVTLPANKYRTVAADTPENRAIALRVVRGEARMNIANELGVTPTRVSQIALALGPAVAAEHGIDWTPKSYPQRRKRNEEGTLVSSGQRQPEQLAMYSPPTSNGAPPLRVQAHPVRDEAEHARERAVEEMKDSVLRQALKERDAFKTVFEVIMREKEQR